MKKPLILGALGALAIGSAAAAWLVLSPGEPQPQQSTLASIRARSSCLPAQKTGQMAWIPPGEVTLGSSEFEPEEAPTRRAEVGGFWIDATEVTNDQFAAFVKATGYRTVAERPPVLPEGVTDVPPEMLQPGGIVFRAPPPGAPAGADLSLWWSWTPGAHWRQPEGPGSSIDGRGHFPVVQIAYEDALAYARWKGHELPSEAEWERAARAGHEGRRYIWGNEPYPGGKQMANSWQGHFPVADTGEDGFQGLAPVGCFAANDFGLYDMAGNVWEWSSEGFSSRSQVIGRVGTEPVSIRGGSWLCAPNYCGRFRPSARQPGDALAGTTHIGFRTIRRGSPPPGGKAGPA